MEAAVVGRGGGAGRELRQRASVARRPQGRRLRDPGLEPRRVGALRLRARLDWRHRRRDLREQLTEGRRLHPRALGVGRRALRGRDPAGEGRVCARRCGEVAPRAHLRRSRRPRRPWARLCGRAPERAAGGRRADRGERPLHLHLHVRDDRAAEGLHDLAPQLLRDGRGRRRPAELHGAGGHDAPLPPARAQLRPPDAPVRRLRRLRDRLPARPAPGGRCAAGGEADRLPERAARLREDPYRRRREVRRRDGRQAEAGRLGARLSAAVSASCDEPGSRCRRR